MTDGAAPSEPMAFDAVARFGLAGRAALVSGAAHGLGLAISSALLGAGCRTAIVDVDAAALGFAAAALRGHDPSATVHPLALDVRDEASVKRTVDDAAAALGGLDILVNCAAIYPTAPLEQMPGEVVLDVLDVNVAGYARMVRAAWPMLVASPAGRVINFASITFHLGFPAGLGAYIADEDVLGLTRALARELGPSGVTVNAIAPGAFPTRAEAIIEDRAAYDQLILASQSIKRRGAVDDIAAAVLFLASDAAGFITGQTLIVDGGWVFD